MLKNEIIKREGSHMPARQGRKRIRDVSIILAVAVLLFFLIEITIRVFNPQDGTYTYIEGTSLAVEDDLLGHVHRPNTVAIEKGPEFTVEYRVNQYGMRDESTHVTPKPSNVLRILLLGDSFTFGAANDYDKIWPVIFEKQLAEKGYRADVIKAGVSGYNTRNEVLYLERLHPQYKPDVVVLTFLPNDLFSNTPISDRQSSRNSPDVRQPASVIKAQDVKKTGLHSVKLVQRSILANDFLYTKLYLSTPRSAYFREPLTERLEQQISVTKELLSRASRYCREKDTVFIVLSIPQQFQVIAKANNYEYDDVNSDVIDQAFLEFSGEEGFRWIPTLAPLAEEYGAGKKALYFRWNGHLNETGNSFVGEYLADMLVVLFADSLNSMRSAAASE